MYLLSGAPHPARSAHPARLGAGRGRGGCQRVWWMPISALTGRGSITMVTALLPHSQDRSASMSTQQAHISRRPFIISQDHHVYLPIVSQTVILPYSISSIITRVCLHCQSVSIACKKRLYTYMWDKYSKRKSINWDKYRGAMSRPLRKLSVLFVTRKC